MRHEIEWRWKQSIGCDDDGIEIVNNCVDIYSS